MDKEKMRRLEDEFFKKNTEELDIVLEDYRSRIDALEGQIKELGEERRIALTMKKYKILGEFTEEDKKVFETYAKEGAEFALKMVEFKRKNPQERKTVSPRIYGGSPFGCGG